MKIRALPTLVSLGLAVSAALLCTPSRLRAADLIPYYTPPAGGGAFVQGAGMVTINNKFVSDVRLVQEATSGTMDIVRKMMQRDSLKKDCFGIFGAPDAWSAYQGRNEYAGKPFTNLRAVVASPGTDVYFVVPAKSPIKTYADAKGKRLGMGGPGSTVANTAQLILDQFGVSKKDFKPYYFTYKETLEGIQDGSLDGGFLAGSYPIASFSELSSRQDVRIVPIDEEHLKKIVAEFPYHYRNVVKAKSYKNFEQDVTILGFASTVWTLAGVSEDIVYRFVKSIFEHRDEFYSIHPSLKWMKPETATYYGTAIPFHPGAEKYYREVGVWK